MINWIEITDNNLPDFNTEVLLHEKHADGEYQPVETGMRIKQERLQSDWAWALNHMTDITNPTHFAHLNYPE